MREDLRAATRETALRDRNRSIFLHRLVLAGVPFARLDHADGGALLEADDAAAGVAAAKPVVRKGASGPAQNTFKEHWVARWTPECEIALAETSLKGDTIEVAAARTLEERLARVSDVDHAARLARRAVLCALPDGLYAAVRTLQNLGVDDAAFGSIAGGLYELNELLAYNNVRQFDAAPLRPIVAQLFLRATLLVGSTCRCNDDAAKPLGEALANVHFVAGQRATHDDPSASLDVERWHRELALVADDDSANPRLAGVASALLLERGLASDEDLERRIARRILPGMNPDAVAGFFEGLASRNRHALFSRRALWRALDGFVQTLSDEEFLRAVAGLRKAFASFALGERRRVAELVREQWLDERRAASSESSAKETSESSAEGASEPRAVAPAPALDEAAAAKLQEDLAGLDLDFDL